MPVPALAAPSPSACPALALRPPRLPPCLHHPPACTTPLTCTTPAGPREGHCLLLHRALAARQPRHRLCGRRAAHQRGADAGQVGLLDAWGWMLDARGWPGAWAGWGGGGGESPCALPPAGGAPQGRALMPPARPQGLPHCGGACGVAAIQPTLVGAGVARAQEQVHVQGRWGCQPGRWAPARRWLARLLRPPSTRPRPRSLPATLPPAAKPFSGWVSQLAEGQVQPVAPTAEDNEEWVPQVGTRQPGAAHSSKAPGRAAASGPHQHHYHTSTTTPTAAIWPAPPRRLPPAPPAGRGARPRRLRLQRGGGGAALPGAAVGGSQAQARPRRHQAAARQARPGAVGAAAAAWQCVVGSAAGGARHRGASASCSKIRFR